METISASEFERKRFISCLLCFEETWIVAWSVHQRCLYVMWAVETRLQCIRAKPVFPKLVRAVAQIKVAIMSYYLNISQLSLIIQNKIVVFVPRYPRKIAHCLRGV